MRIHAAAAVSAAVLTASLVGASSASASKNLTFKQRQDIIRSVYVEAPDGGRIRHATCIAGRVSTVDRRWAFIYLSNTDWCVAVYGGASGEGSLMKRKTQRRHKWKHVGQLGDNCKRGTGGASDLVLRDLGCTLY